MNLCLVALMVSLSAPVAFASSCDLTHDAILSGFDDETYACSETCACETKCFDGDAALLSGNLDPLAFQAACDAASLTKFTCTCIRCHARISSDAQAGILVGLLFVVCFTGLIWWFVMPPENAKKLRLR